SYDDAAETDFWGTYLPHPPDFATLLFAEPPVPEDPTAPGALVVEIQRQLRELHGPEARVPEPYTALYRNWVQDPYGAAYHFVSEEEFRRLIEAGDLIEWAHVHGNYYGTSRKFLEDCASRGKVVILDIDVQGVESLKRRFPDRTLSVFILPPSMEELENRLRSRGTESEEKLQARLAAAREEISHAPRFDARVVNHDLRDSFRELCALLEREVGLVH
ncbi:MAG: guanylate kinase, partial [Bdellovibrionales bacterium]|nr:guanylate kinase [Bdellovibrionales bacterium]